MKFVTALGLLVTKGTDYIGVSEKDYPSAEPRISEAMSILQAIRGLESYVSSKWLSDMNMSTR